MSTKPKIMLIVPCTSEKRSSAITNAGAEHIGVGYLAGYLRHCDYEVEILNLEVIDHINTFMGKERDVLMENFVNEKINNFKPAIVGITVTLLTIHESIKICRDVKKAYPDVYTVFGGPHVSVCPEQVLQNEPEVDFVIVGDGEEPLLNLVKSIEQGTDYSNVTGLVYRVGNEVKVNKFESSVNLNIDKMPPPSRDDLIYARRFVDNDEARLSTSRGCKENCTFCCDPVIYPDRKWVGRSAKLVVDEIEYLNKELGINHFWINDDNFIPPTEEGRKRAKEIADLIVDKDLKITYRALFRANTFVENDELLPLLSKSGLRIAYVGLESGSQTKLKRFNKKTNVEQYYVIVNELKKNGIGLQVGFIMFDPFTNFDDLSQDSRFLYNIGEMYLVSNFVQILDVFPGTFISKLMIRSGLLKEEVRYNSGYCDYEFENEFIEKMARGLNIIYKDEIVQIDRELQRIKIINVPKLCEKASVSDKAYLKQRSESLFSEVNNYNYDFFNALMDMAQNESWDDERFTTLFNNVVSHSSKKLDELHKLLADMEAGINGSHV